MWTSEKTRNGGNLRAKSKVEILIGKKSKPVWYVGSGTVCIDTKEPVCIGTKQPLLMHIHVSIF